MKVGPVGIGVVLVACAYFFQSLVPLAFLCGVGFGLFYRTVKTIAVFLYHLIWSPMDNYDLDHTVLNFTPTPSTWMNWGYWEARDDFCTACQNLAFKLGTLAELKKDDFVLDVGFGCGDQDVFWHKHFGLLSLAWINLRTGPLKITGINISQVQVEAGQALVSQNQLAEDILLERGSAPVINFSERSFNKVLSLDSAYHFNTRELFFAEAFRVLKPGGFLALADVIFDVDFPPGIINSAKKFALTSFISLFLGVPKQNFYTAEHYSTLLKRKGFCNVTLEQLPHEKVWGAFRKWIRTHCTKINRFMKEDMLLNFERAAALMETLSRHRYISLILVKAEKPH